MRFFLSLIQGSQKWNLLRQLAISMLILLGGAPFLTAGAQQYTRGIGVYPGDPRQNFAPSMQVDRVHYRNLALDRPAYQSSSYDYNLTAQLITDGIIDTILPGWIVTSTSSFGIQQRNGREHVLDRHASSTQALEGPAAWLQIEMAGHADIPVVDSFNLSGSLLADSLPPKSWEVSIEGSPDGITWDTLGMVQGKGLPGRDAFADFRRRFPNLNKMSAQQLAFFSRFFPPNRRMFSFPFKTHGPIQFRYYRFDVHDPNARSWTIGDFGIFDQGKYAEIGGPYHFTSAWKSQGSQREWVYVDLGAECLFNRVKLYWISRARSGSIQVSEDARNWKDIAGIPDHPDRMDDIKLSGQVKGRYVRVLMTAPASPANGYILSELQVMGTGGPVPIPHPQAIPGKQGRMNLAGGAWKLQRVSQVPQDGRTISTAGYQDKGWLVATVPGTELVSYLNDGALPDPNFGDNQLLISDAYFYSDFWYRDVFTPPVSYKGRDTYLNFDGINWEAEVFLNGHDLGSLKGAFIRGRFDVTGILIPGRKNVLAVRIIKNDTPGFPTEQNRNSTDANGGELGADNPTFHASIGWDWIPTIRGRNTGIWNKVYLSQSGPVTIRNPFVSARLPLPDTTSADLTIKVTLHNHLDRNIQGLLTGKIGNISFKKKVHLGDRETRTITLNPSTNPALRWHHPRLWWPNGYGKQHLYRVHLAFLTADGRQSDVNDFRTGIREMTYSQAGGALRIWVNGRRFIPRGGNWGFAEDLLRYRAREYDIAIKYHQEMHFNMIRDWVGQVADDAFYQACDRYGIMIWQDFWLANPSDGPDPIHPAMFIRNMQDYVRRIRNHPSIALFVGRNEGNPPPVLETALTKDLPVLDPGIKYIPNSAFGPVSGGGPYRLMPLKFYFQFRATPKLHSEMGLPDIVSYKSLKRMMPVSAIWPQSRMWGVHDFTLQGAQNGASFNKTIEETFGKVDQLKKWLSLAQWTAYQGYRAMFEAQSAHRMGLLIWMSHPSWPSLTWQTYDYYFDPTAAYFGCRRACEPLHIQWNPLSDSIEVVNYSIPDGSGLLAKLELVNLDGTVKYQHQVKVNCPPDSTVAVFPVIRPAGLSPVYFIRCLLTRGNTLISRNLYWRGLSGDTTAGFGDLSAVTKLPNVKLLSQTKVSKSGNRWLLTTTLTNHTHTPALIVHLEVVGAKSRKRILPVIYSDNFMTLLPGDQRTVKIQVKDADTRGEKPVVEIKGLNVME